MKLFSILRFRNSKLTKAHINGFIIISIKNIKVETAAQLNTKERDRLQHGFAEKFSHGNFFTLLCFLLVIRRIRLFQELLQTL